MTGQQNKRVPNIVFAYDFERGKTYPAPTCFQAFETIHRTHNYACFTIPATIFFVARILTEDREATAHLKELVASGSYEIASHTTDHIPVREHPLALSLA